MLGHYMSKFKKRINLLSFKLLNLRKETFECPVCGYSGPFRDFSPATGPRKHAQCPSCNALERHRLQFIVINDILKYRNAASMKMLHFAPEPFFRQYFAHRFGQYETADLLMAGVDHKVDIQRLPFSDETYDLVFASHVLEHIQDDNKALAEIRRILKPNGIAILPVPLIAETTVEYPAPNPHEFGHVRAPGKDYFLRYEHHFAKVEIITSDSLPMKYQLFVYEDRSKWPSQECPLRPAMPGERHIDIVPVCYV